MRSRSFVVVALTIVGLLVFAGAVLAYDSSQSKTIANGVKVGGVDVGGLTVSQARARLRRAYSWRFARPLRLTFAHHRYKLTAKQARLHVNVDASVQEALDRTRSSNLLVRVFRSVTGSAVNVDLNPQVRYFRPALTGVVRDVAHDVNTPPVNAHIGFSGNSIKPIPGSPGLQVQTAQLSAAVDGSVMDAMAHRHISIPVSKIQPNVTTAQLAASNPTIITVNRAAFTLKLWKHLRLVKSYQIAVGQQGLETPAGLYHIMDKEVDPSWQVPNSAWAGSLAGQTIPPGPDDPLKARWMGIYDGAGIHGTDELDSLGTAASHGCIRMAIPDVIELYSKTPLGTPVYIV